MTTKDYDTAIIKYSLAIDQWDGDHNSLMQLHMLFANRAHARIQAGYASHAAHDAALALCISPSKWWPRLRLAEALLEAGRPDAAATELQRLLSAPSLKDPDAKRDAAILLRRAAADSEQPSAGSSSAEESAAASSTTSAGRSMLERAMTLRLHLCPPLPSAIRMGGWHTISIRLSNEMGLFDARTFERAARGHVRLIAVALSADGGPHEPKPLPELCIRVRQAPEEVPPPEGEQPFFDWWRLKSEMVALLELRRGRAIAEVCIDFAPGYGGWPPPLIALQAELILPDDGDGESESGGGTLGALSLPLPVERGASEVDPRSDDVVKPSTTAKASLVRTALHPLLNSSKSSHLLELVSGFRLLPIESSILPQLPLVLAESSSGICGRVWDSGVWMAKWLGNELSTFGGVVYDQRRGQVQPKDVSIVELGSGVGVAGLAAAAIGAKVLLTDLEEALPMLQLNAAVNAHRCEHVPSAAALGWGDELESLQPLIEWRKGIGSGEDDELLVLCSDVVYEPEAYTPLLGTLKALASNGIATRTLMAHRSRHPDESLFFSAAREHFVITLLEGPPFVPLGSEEGVECMCVEEDSASSLAAPEGESSSSSAVRLLEFVWRHRPKPPKRVIDERLYLFNANPPGLS